MKGLFTFLLDRAKERNSVIGAVSLVATATGYAVSPELAGSIATVVAAVAGTVSIVLPDKK